MVRHCSQRENSAHLGIKGLKTDSGHVALLSENFFFISNPERFSSSLKKTIVLYLVKKFETFMVIFTSGRKRVFFKKRFCISDSRTIHLTLNLQARHYRNINYYKIYECNFTQYYLSMFRNKKKNWKLFISAFRFILRCFEKIINLFLKNNKNAILVFAILSITSEKYY